MIEVSDVVQYLYCPRKVYFIRIAGIKITKPKMEEGKAIHDDARRSLKSFAEKLGGELLTGIYLESERYGLKGIVDAVVKAADQVYPIDVKLSRFESLTYAWKMQIAAYAMLVEGEFGVRVEKGFIYLVERRKFLEVPIQPEDRKSLKRIVVEVEELLRSGKYPRASKSKRCGYCEMEPFCV